MSSSNTSPTESDRKQCLSSLVKKGSAPLQPLDCFLYQRGFQSVNTPLQRAVSATALSIFIFASCQALGQQSHPYNTRTQIHPIQSWASDPCMSQAEEERLTKWVLSRPKSRLAVTTEAEFYSELAAVAKADLGTELIFDLRSFEIMGMSIHSAKRFPDSRILPAGTDLFSVLEELDVTFMIHRGHIRITTRDAAENRPLIRIYDVTPLVTVHLWQGRLVVETFELINVIQASIEPDAWDALGGTYTIHPIISNNHCLLTIAADSRVHLQVQSLLDHIAFASQISTAENAESSLADVAHRPQTTGRQDSSSSAHRLRPVPNIPLSRWGLRLK